MPVIMQFFNRAPEVSMSICTYDLERSLQHKTYSQKYSSVSDSVYDIEVSFYLFSTVIQINIKTFCMICRQEIIVELNIE